jgi:hypothetical protein
MRKLLVAVSAVLMVGVGASAAQAQPGNQCPKPEVLKFEAPFSGTQGGITVTAADGDNTVTFSIGNQVTVTQICVKAGTTAAVFNNFETDGSMTNGGISITYSCTSPGAITDSGGDGNNDLVGPCTVTANRGGPGQGLSHVTFYTASYVAPAAQVAPLVEAQGESAVSGGAAGGLAFTGAQLSIMLAILAGLILAGTLAWTAGRRRAAKTD